MKIFLLFSITFLSIITIGQTSTSVNYTINTTDIANPGRGFYKHFETTINTTNASPALTLTELQNLRIDSNITIILKVYYLGAYKTSAISAAYLTGIQNDMNTVRNAGAKMIVRFAFNNTTQTHRHSNDANLARILSHLNHLKPVLNANADIILTVQTGFIGTWGEWYYTDPDFTNVSPVGSANNANRKQVTDSLLKILPANKTLQIRVAEYKYNTAMYGNGSSGVANAITAAEAYNGTPKSRIGHHNDCFLAAVDDYGTYLSSPMSLDKDYIEQDTKYVMNGGETCNDDATYTNCTNAQTELVKLRYTFLNISYNATVLDRWRTNGCFTTIKRKLGYRFELSNGNFTTTASSSYNYDISFNLSNSGYAPIYEKNKVQLILKNTSTLAKYIVDLDSVDIRKWLPGTNYHFNKTFGIGNIPNGNYNLLLVVKDSAAAITNDIKYNIRFANTGIWDATEGANILRSNITLNSAVNPGTGSFLGTSWFGTPQILSADLLDFKASSVNSFTTLSWQMALPNNINSITIEKSLKGTIFNNIATVNNNNSSYFYKDEVILQNNITFYRLKLINTNGEISYSKIIRVLKNDLIAQIINIFPQPAKSFATLELNSKYNCNTILFLTNLDGKIVLQKPIHINVGNNQINNIDVNNLPAGIYICKILINGTNLFSKLIKD